MGNLNNDKYKVDNKWNNPGSSAMSWKNAEERKDIVDWLGDAVYAGDNNKTSFGNDDYIADLDADTLRTKVSLSDLCRLFSSILRVLRTNTGQYLTEKPVKWAETGGAKMVAGLLSQAPREDIAEYQEYILYDVVIKIWVDAHGGSYEKARKKMETLKLIDQTYEFSEK